MQHNLIIRVSLTPGGYIRSEVVSDKSDGRYVGRVATRQYVVNVYAVRMLTQERDAFIITKVMVWLVRRGIL